MRFIVITLAFSCILLRPSSAGSTNFAYVSNYGSDTVTVIDTETDRTVATITVGPNPWGVAFLPDGSRAYVVVPGSGPVIIDTSTLTVVPPSVPIGDHGLAITPNGQKAYAVNFSTNSVSAIAIATNSISTIPVGRNPREIAITPDGAKAYVTNFGFGSGSVSVIDTTIDAVIATISPLADGSMDDPTVLDITPDGHTAYVTNAPHEIVVIDTTTDRVIDSITDLNFANAVAISPDATNLYINTADGLLVLNRLTKVPIVTIPIQAGPDGLAVTPDGRKVYVTQEANNAVAAVDVSALPEYSVKSIQVGAGPRKVAIPRSALPSPNDVDQDGVPDISDRCPGTSPHAAVDPYGCSCSQKLCDDGNDCTVNRCINGECDFSEAVDCDDHSDCTHDTCDPSRGCVYQRIPARSLCFPLKGTSAGRANENLTPNNAPIVSVFDHSMSSGGTDKFAIYKCDGLVEAYSGESATLTPSPPKGCKTTAYTQGLRATFRVNGCYCGTRSDGPTYLNYEGHPGYDFRACDHTPVYAATSGTVYYPTSMVGLGNTRDWNVLGLIPDGDSAHVIYYLHLSTPPPGRYVTAVQTTDPHPTGGCPSVVSLPIAPNTHVDAGCLVALSGHAAPSSKRPLAPHLHFEVQMVVPQSQLLASMRKEAVACIDKLWVPASKGKACLPVDPYGWTGIGPDTFEAITGIVPERLWHDPQQSEKCAEQDCGEPCP